MPKFIRINARNKEDGTFSPAILNTDIFDNIVPASEHAEEYPEAAGVGAIIFTKNTSLLPTDEASTYAVKETVDELWEMLK